MSGRGRPPQAAAAGRSRRGDASAQAQPRRGNASASLLRSAAILAAGALASAAVVLAVYDRRGALLTLALLVGLGAVSLSLAHLAAARRAGLGSLRRQFSLAVALAVGQLVVLAAAFAALMFVSAHDALMVAVVVCFAGLVAARAAQLLAAGVMDDVEAVRDGLHAVGEGDRDARVRTSARDELAELAQAANAMAVRLGVEEGARDAADAARRDLVAAVSHDLRTPLTSLRLLAEAVDDEIVDEHTRRRYLAQMQTHIRALSALIDDLFELSRLEAGDIQWSVERVRLDELVDETVDAMRAEARAKRIAMVTEVADRLEPVPANTEKVQRVLFNLIQNAIRHTPADGSVTIRAQTTGDALEVEVADTGDGIAPDERERVFDAFFRGGTETARTRAGAGLGLAISRAIVEAHGGRIWLADSTRGTRVRFSLPAGDGPGLRKREERRPEAAREPAGA